jgi:hypothetical protein
MTGDHHCRECSASGCTSRHTEEQANEEVKAAPFLLYAAIVVLAVSMLVKWIIG